MWKLCDNLVSGERLGFDVKGYYFGALGCVIQQNLLILYKKVHGAFML